MTYQLATIAAANAEAAYRFYSVNHDRAEAEYWWSRVVYWQELAQAMQR
jgi:hypothetical protein